MMPLSFFILVAKMTNKYCYEDWVVEKKAQDRDGMEKKSAHSEDVPPLLPGTREKYPGRRHFVEKKKNYTAIPGFIIACALGSLPFRLQVWQKAKIQ